MCDIPFAFYVKMAIYSITKCFFNFQTLLRPPKDNQKSLKLLMSILYPHVITSQQLQVSRSFGKVLARFQSWLQQRNIAKMLTFSVTFDPVGKYTPSWISNILLIFILSTYGPSLGLGSLLLHCLIAIWILTIFSPRLPNSEALTANLKRSNIFVAVHHKV